MDILFIFTLISIYFYLFLLFFTTIHIAFSLFLFPFIMYTTKRHVKKLYLFEKLHDLKSLVNDFSSTEVLYLNLWVSFNLFVQPYSLFWIMGNHNIFTVPYHNIKVTNLATQPILQGVSVSLLIQERKKQMNKAEVQ